MSFDQSYIPINRFNYEEAFLLYIDGELNEECRAAVEAFVLLHPNLKEEMDVLLSTKLDPPFLKLEGKESLLSAHMKVAEPDEALLLYMDGELPGEKILAVEKKMAADDGYNLLYQDLLHTRLPEEKIIYPFKEDLYRHTQKRVQRKIWLSIAASVIVLLAIGFLWFVMGSNNAPDPSLAMPKPQNMLHQKISDDLILKMIELAPPTDVTLPRNELAATEKIMAEKTPLNKEVFALPSTTPHRKSNESSIVITRQPINNLPLLQSESNPLIPLQQQTINNTSVTTGTSPAYITSEGTADAETMVSYAVALSSDDKKGSVRGFLRKASRFIERRTGFNPLNEDDELLIGAVALKLK